MVFIYSQGVSSQYQDFTERLMSHLALKGTEITQQVLKETNAQMHVKHTDEQGHLDIAVENENVKVSYTVDRERKEISKGVMGAITGAGLGGVLGNVLRKNEGLGDAAVQSAVQLPGGIRCLWWVRRIKRQSHQFRLCACRDHQRSRG
jgi:hypothetical protein